MTDDPAVEADPASQRQPAVAFQLATPQEDTAISLRASDGSGRTFSLEPQWDLSSPDWSMDNKNIVYTDGDILPGPFRRPGPHADNLPQDVWHRGTIFSPRRPDRLSRTLSTTKCAFEPFPEMRLPPTPSRAGGWAPQWPATDRALSPRSSTAVMAVAIAPATGTTAWRAAPFPPDSGELAEPTARRDPRWPAIPRPDDAAKRFSRRPERRRCWSSVVNCYGGDRWAISYSIPLTATGRRSSCLQGAGLLLLSGIRGPAPRPPHPASPVRMPSRHHLTNLHQVPVAKAVVCGVWSTKLVRRHR